MRRMLKYTAGALFAGLVVLGGVARADEDINAWGKPDFEKGDKLAAAVWRDGDGWHIRWTTKGKPHQFSGWIHTPDGQFTDISQVGKERGDWARVTPADKRLVFDTTTKGGVDGFDFRSNSSEFTFQVLVDGKEMPDRIFIGANNRNPSKLPFKLQKWESHPRGGGGAAGGPVGMGGEDGPGDGPGEDINAWGKPDFEKGEGLGVAIWRDGDGWHIRWTTRGNPHKFSGWIYTPDGQFTDLGQVGKERGDWARVTPADKRLVFDTTTKAGVDGFDFRSNSSRFTFQIFIDGKEMPGHVFIGDEGRHPTKMPFAITKWESRPGRK